MARKRKPLAVTLTQIESEHPCASQYRAFLKDMKANALPGGAYAAYARAMKYKDPAYGPNDPIPLSVILDTKSSGMDPDERIEWLLARLFPGLLGKIDERAQAIQETAYRQARKELIG